MFIAHSANGDDPAKELRNAGALTGKLAASIWPESHRRGPGYELDASPLAVRAKEKDDCTVVVIGENWKGGKDLLQLLPRVSEVRGLMFSHPDSHSDDWLEILSQLPELEELSISGGDLTDKTLTHISKLSKLRFLSLLGTHATDDGVKKLAKLEHLEFLSFYGDQRVTGECFADGFSGLRRLNARGITLTQNGLNNISKLTEIDCLSLSMVPSSALDFRPIRRLSKLTFLDLSIVHLPPEAFKSVAELSELVAIELRYTDADDTIFPILASLKQLQKVNLSYSVVTAESLEKFKKAHPDMNITHRFREGKE